MFELGLFMGAIGRGRTFMLVERKRHAIRLPSDLHGVTYLSVETRNAKLLAKGIDAAVLSIRNRIAEIGTR